MLCSSVVLMLLLLSKLYSYHAAADTEPTYVPPHDSLSQGALLQEDISDIQNTPYFASLNFAEENLPLGDKQIETKMMRYLKEYSYTKRRSHRLHRQALQALPKVTTILRKYGVPEDLKYIPLVESGFMSGTTSHRGASGYWQFMPQTARAFGLRVDHEVDERQNIEKSTIAAAKYLKALYRAFNSWTLVAAAFNIGEGNLQRAINRQREDNYFRLKLNKETGSYVYKLISVKEIIEHPTMHGYRKNRVLLANASADRETSSREKHRKL